MPVVSIADTRNIIRTIRKKYHYDFSNYALTSFRYRLDEVFEQHHISFPDILIRRLIEDEEFLDEFLYDISIPQTEIFRDPEMWIRLRDDVLPNITARPGLPGIWFPDCSDSNDLSSTFYLLKSLGITRKVKIFVSCLSRRMIRELKTGQIILNHHSAEAAQENFNKVSGEHPAVSYESMINPGSDFRNSLSRKAIFFKQNTDFEPTPGEVFLIVFRNKLLSLTPDFQNQIIGKLADELVPGGFLILGYKENIDDYLVKYGNLDVFDKQEKIFRKKPNEKTA